jgi:hypothetical protein
VARRTTQCVATIAQDLAKTVQASVPRTMCIIAARAIGRGHLCALSGAGLVSIPTAGAHGLRSTTGAGSRRNPGLTHDVDLETSPQGAANVENDPEGAGMPADGQYLDAAAHRATPLATPLRTPRRLALSGVPERVATPAHTHTAAHGEFSFRSFHVNGHKHGRVARPASA